MSIHSVTYYEVHCDCCNDPAEYGDFSAWADQSTAVEQLDDEWATIEEKHYCRECWVPSSEAYSDGGEPVLRGCEASHKSVSAA